MLHPRRDARGVHRFDRDEVEALARDLDAGRLSLADARRSDADESYDGHVYEAPCSRCADLQEEVNALNDELERVQRSHRREVETLQQESERAQAELRSELSAIERVVNDFAATMEAMR